MIQQHHHYFLFEAISANTLDGEYNLALVFLSYLIATLAGLCAFSIVNLLPKLEANRVFLLLIGGVVLGLGVWGMHFTGMLAFSLPTEVRYDPEITLISTFPAIVCSIIFLENLTKKKLSQLRIAMVALALASGIGAMHFTGMMAMSMKAYMTHDLILYVLAILSSWALAVITIVIHKTKKSMFNRKQHAILCAMTFGFSVASMHYLAMLSTYFVEDSSLTVTGIGNEFITNSLVVFTIILMTLFLIVLFFQNKVGNLKQVAKLHHHRVTLTIDNMQDAFVLGDCSGNIILVNRIFTEVFGTEILSSDKQENSLKNLYDKLTNKVFEFDDEQQLEEVLVVLNDQSCIDVQLRLKDIHENWWLLRRSTTPTNEVIQTWTNISDQVSQELEIKKAKDAALKALEDLKNTQEELVETKKMASLGGLVTGVAHELNTPLGISITGLSSIKELAEEVQAHIDQGTLKKSELEDSIESIVEFEVLVAKNLERMNTLIQQFKYISVDQDIDCASTFKLVNVLTDLVSTKQSKIKEQKIDVIIDAPDVEITTFETALIQVVDSLLSNALEHAFNAHDDPRISMTLSQCDDELHLLIEDNGSGIPDALKATIFDPFVTSKRGSGGVGLGLYIAYNLVSQKLGGKIKLLEDNSDNLTRFLVILPLSIK